MPKSKNNVKLASLKEKRYNWFFTGRIRTGKSDNNVESCGGIRTKSRNKKSIEWSWSGEKRMEQL
jgi:hypothetical protein